MSCSMDIEYICYIKACISILLVISRRRVLLAEKNIFLNINRTSMEILMPKICSRMIFENYLVGKLFFGICKKNCTDMKDSNMLKKMVFGIPWIYLFTLIKKFGKAKI